MDFDSVKWWLEDNWKTLVGVVAILTVLGGAFFLFRVEADRAGTLPDSYAEQVQTLEENSDVIKETFSVFDSVNVSTVDGQVAYEISLYNKKPFIETGDLEQVLRRYVDTMEIVEGTYDREVRALKFSIYDRKTKFDLGAKPDGVYYYGLPFSSLPEEEKEDTNSRYYSMSPDDVAYEYTSLYAPDKLDKDEYQLYGSYRQLRRVSGVEPLTDQEYDWFAKLDKYIALGADSGSMYLEWELGAPKSSSVARSFMQDVRKFKERLSAVGDETTMYGNGNLAVQDLKRQLVIENPSFLWYAETGKIEEDAIEARSLLVEEFPADYQNVVEEWVKTLAEDQIRQMNEGVDPATSGNKEDGLDSLESGSGSELDGSEEGSVDGLNGEEDGIQE